MFGLSPRLASEALRDTDDHEFAFCAVDLLQPEVRITPGDIMLEPFIKEDVVSGDCSKATGANS